jgi:hypothetical protein
MSWEIARIAFYMGFVIGAPAFFLFLVSQKKIEDLNEAEAYFYKRAEQESKSFTKKLTLDFEKKLEEKDALIKKKEAELEKIRPFLKYLRQPPPTSGTPS